MLAVVPPLPSDFSKAETLLPQQLCLVLILGFSTQQSFVYTFKYVQVACQLNEVHKMVLNI